MCDPTTCTKVTPPDPVNQCNSQGDTYLIPGLCTMLGRNTNQQWCENNISVVGEWTMSNDPPEVCSLFNAPPYDSEASGCPFICESTGAVSSCVRSNFLADPTTCCMQDLNCNTSFPDLCFQYGTTGVTQKTCSPETRDITSDTCQDVVMDYCSGADLAANDSSWIYRWMNTDGTPLGYNPTGNPLNNGCIYAIQRNVFSTVQDICGVTGIPGLINASGYLWSQNLLNKVFAKYKQNGFVFGSLPGTVNYNLFQDFLEANVCSGTGSDLGSLPAGLCTQGLKESCSNFTTNDILRNPELANICGCYLPDSEYENYINGYGISKQCTPLCNRSSSIPLANAAGQEIICETSVCLIDDVTINVINSSVKGGIQVENICNNCSRGNFNNGGNSDLTTCQCILEDLTVDALNSTIGNNLVVNEMCGSNGNNSLCTTNENGKIVTIPCDYESTDNPIQEYQNEIESAENKSKTVYWVFVSLILALAFIIFLSFLFFYKTRDKKIMMFFVVLIFVLVIIPLIVYLIYLNRHDF